MNRLRFRYTNYKGEDHEYTIEPSAFTFKDSQWMITGLCLQRDGQTRDNYFGGFPLRSFVLVEMRDIREVGGARD